MARQKRPISEIARQPDLSLDDVEVVDVVQEEDEDFLDDDSLDESLPAQEWLERGKKAQQEETWDDCLNCYTQALRCKLRDLGGGDMAELSPEVAEFWFRNGDALLCREEQLGSIFSSKEGEDTKQSAYEALDLARICYEKKILASMTQKPIEVPEGVIECLQFIVDHESWEEQATDADVAMLMNTRLRMGDLYQATYEYEAAIQEFLSALRLALSYRSPIPECLTPAIPLALCLMALDSPETELAFKACDLLVDRELLSPNLSDKRRDILVSTRDDMSKQLQEYLQERSTLAMKTREVLKEILTGASAEPISDAPETPVKDLGVMGKKSKRNEDV